MKRKEFENWLERRSIVNHGSLRNHEARRNSELAKKRIEHQMRREIALWNKADEL